jgi:ubiquinone/menaquinone biosynthesis C-methylase UbiE
MRGVFWRVEMENRPQQRDLVRDQFTRTARVFGDYAVSSRVPEAERLARMVRAGAKDRAVDIACGSGTLALRLARHVGWICGVDLTPAILDRARRFAAEGGLRNLAFALGDAEALPFGDDMLDLAVTSYSLHHLTNPARAIDEMARVVNRGGRVGVLDIFVPEDPGVAAMQNRIERIRDRSHARTLARGELEAYFAQHGLRVLETHVETQVRPFDHWMLVAGLNPSEPRYQQVRRLLEESMADDSAWLHPRLVPAGKNGQQRELVIENTVLFIAGEKI